MDIGELISRAKSGDTAQLPSGEFEGPIVIDKPLRLVGQNTTLWAKNGPVLKVKSGGVTLEKLRIEITEGSRDDTAVFAESFVAAKDVEVYGKVRGFGSEDGLFDVPRTIELGEFKSDTENSFRLEVNVPVKTEIRCASREIDISPTTLMPGRNDLRITVSGSSQGTLLFAELLFCSGFTRRVYLTGRPRGNAGAAKDKLIYTAPQRSEKVPTPVSEPVRTDVISMVRTQNTSLESIALKRGQRIAAADYLGSRFSIYFTCDKPRGIDIDPYVFLLDKTGKALDEKNLVFFGNERAKNGEAVYFPADGHIEIDLAAADYRVEKIVLAYAVYAADKMKNFSVVNSPRLSLRTDRERISFEPDRLTYEAAIVALEFYLYKGEWKINAVGAGYNDGMAKMCNSFGIEVEE